MNPHAKSLKNSLYPSAITLLVLATLGMSTAAIAQSESNASNKNESNFTVDAGLAYSPEYEGSEDYKTSVLPLINYRNGRFFAGALGGIGYDLSTKKGLSIGPVLSYQPGRDESDHERLKGLGDIDPSANLGAFVKWDLQPFSVNSTIKQGLGGDVSGTELKLGVGYALPLGPKDSLNFDASINWADQDIMEGYFGVTPEQSNNSGLATYDASAGIRRYGVGASWTHIYTPKVFSTLNAGVYQLGSEAADSPITTSRTGGLVGASVGYKF